MLDLLAGGRDVAVVTDAGTPGISDPGERLVRAALDAGHPVSAVPGPAAAVMALVVSGLPTARFVFEGFLPRSGRDRSERLAEIAAERRTVVLYEAPHRIERTLADLRGGVRRRPPCGRRPRAHEAVRGRDTWHARRHRDRRRRAASTSSSSRAPVAEPVAADDDAIRAALRSELAAGATKKDAVAAVSSRLGAPRRTVYALAVSSSPMPTARRRPD